MKTQTCAVACNDGIAITDQSRGALHRKCPGGYRNQDGKVRFCDCECHGDRDPSTPAIELLDAVAEGLPVLHEPVPAGGPGPTRKDRPRPRAGAKRACEHCGAPTGGRFAPGHDAKLKSELTKAAVAGDAEAVAELILRDWLILVPEGKILDTTEAAGTLKAQHEGYALVHRRNSIRISRGGS